MIFPSNRVRVVVATQTLDFRRQHDDLVAYVKSALRKFTVPISVESTRRIMDNEPRPHYDVLS